MKPNSRNQLILTAALFIPLLLVVGACSERNPADLPVAKGSADPVVFDDAFGPNVDYSAFEFSFYEALSQEPTGGYDDSATLKVTVPAGNWAGGAFWTHVARDLSSFNAVTFWAKASQAVELSECGFGIPIVVPNQFQTTVSGIALTDAWKLVTIPIPDPGKLTSEQGVFWFSQGVGGVEIWLDEIIYGQVTGITNPRPSMKSQSIQALLDESVPITDTKTIFSVNGVDVDVVHSPDYFTYFSTDTTVVTSVDGVLTAVGGGTATVTAMLAGTDVDGEVIVTVIAPPADPAPTPTLPQSDVIPLFSDAYTNNISVTSWRTNWSSPSTAVFDQQIQGDNVKAYTGLNNMAYVGIDFAGDQIDATAAGMTHFTMDVFAPAGSMLAVKLVDFGPDGVFGGGDDSEKSLTFHAGSTPAFTPGQWVTLDVPLTQFTGMNFANVAQMVLQSTNIGNLWVDNIYFYK